MKKTFFNVIIILLLSSIVILLITHHQKISEELCVDQSTASDNEVFLDSIRFRPNINRKDYSKYQSFQVDLLNQISIVGKITPKSVISMGDSTEIKHIDFKIFETISCSRYEITEMFHESDYNSNYNLHALIFNIEEITDRNKEQTVYRYTPIKELRLENEDQIFSIITGDRRLRTERIQLKEQRERIEQYRAQETVKLIIPPRICQGIVGSGD